MSPEHLKTIVFISIGVFFLISGFLLTRTQTTAVPTLKENYIPTTQRRTIGHKLQSRETNVRNSLTQFRETEFYRTIIDNNLFRPLGWRPARPRDPYRLLGTLIPKDRDTPRKAILQATVGNTTHTVRIGATLGEYILADIQPKQVILEKDGQAQTLKLNTAPWIK